MENTHKMEKDEKTNKDMPPQNGIPEPQEAETAPPAPSKTPKRDALRKRLKERYPDKDLDDDEAFAGQINDDYDESDRRLKQYEADEKQMSDFFAKDPRSGAFLQAWRNGKNPIYALVSTYGDEFMDYMDDPENQEELAKAQQEYLDRVAKSKELDDEYEKNISKSLDSIEQAQEKNGWDEDYVNNGLKTLSEIVDDYIMGKIDPKWISLLNNGASHDKDVAEAREAGIVNGRNAKIEAKLRKNNATDGSAHLSGGGRGPMPKPQPRRARTIFDEAAGAE